MIKLHNLMFIQRPSILVHRPAGAEWAAGTATVATWPDNNLKPLSAAFASPVCTWIRSELGRDYRQLSQEPENHSCYNTQYNANDIVPL